MEIGIGIGLGLVAGFLSGLVGIGGGTVIIPVLVLGLGYTQHEAQGTALMAFAFPVFAAAAWNYYKFGRVRVRLALIMGISLAITSYLVAAWVQRIDSRWLTRIFAVFLIAVAAYVFWKSIRPLPVSGEERVRGGREVWVALLVGGITGAIKGLTGLGGGVVIVPLLLLLGRLDQHTAQGTSLLTMTLPVAFLAALPYWQHGHVHWHLTLGLVGGVLMGSFLSSRLAQKLAGPFLARIFALTISILGITMLLR